MVLLGDSHIRHRMNSGFWVTKLLTLEIELYVWVCALAPTGLCSNYGTVFGL